MTTTAGEKISLFRQTFVDLDATRSEWWPWVLVFGLFFASLHLGVHMLGMDGNPLVTLYQHHPELRSHPDLVKNDLALRGEYNKALIDSIPALVGVGAVYILGVCLVEFVAFYIFGVIQINKSGAARLHYNAPDFFYYLRKIIWKYIRPVLWVFIPFVGVFFYMRSVIRYNLVTPLALLRSGDELKTSWVMTEGNWWRIFLNQLGIGFCTFLLVSLLSLVPIGIAVFATHGHKTEAFAAFIAVLQGLGTGLFCVVMTGFTCATYKVLLLEQGQRPTSSPSVSA